MRRNFHRRVTSVQGSIVRIPNMERRRKNYSRESGFVLTAKRLPNSTRPERPASVRSGRFCERACTATCIYLSVTPLVFAELQHGAFRVSPSFFGRLPESDKVGFGRIRRFNPRMKCGVVRLLKSPIFGEQAVTFNTSHDRRNANAHPTERIMPSTV